ncbi:MAG: aspartyl protease family protein [Acidobacteriaceae bacterium]|nr:aspartyl protease family protein [Acidobacteriaceae bacterium]MBV9939366.1 aspartyl protease family protein [Acidobacteriaceae bacterium]
MFRSNGSKFLPLLLATFVLETHGETPVPVQLTPFLKGGLVLNAQVNGKFGTFLFDTGAGVTSITPQFAAAIDCKPWGQISGFTITAQRLDMQRCDSVNLQIAGFETRREIIGVFDVDQMMLSAAPKLDGTVALDVFVHRSVAFSYSAKTLRVSDTPKLPQTAALPVHIVRDAEGLALSVNLPVTTSRGIAWFGIDSGNVSPFTLIAKPYAELFTLDGSAKGPQKTELHLADGLTFASDARVMDLILDGNLGVTFLSNYDLAHGRAWLTAKERQNP